MTCRLRIGIDLGGTKIAAAALTPDGNIVGEAAAATPRGDYEATLEVIHGLVAEVEAQAAGSGTIGVGMPGSLSPASGRVQNANSTWLNGTAFDRDLQRRLGRRVRVANDANCFALSEACDGAGAGARCVFGVILGTGCGGGIVFRGNVLDGPRGIGGEWGHNPLPWPEADEVPGPPCWCGRRGCMETWVSGPAITEDHGRATGERVGAEALVERAAAGDDAACATLRRHGARLARGLAGVTNILDPDVIVLGGGLSAMEHLYRTLPELMSGYIFAESREVVVRPPLHGPASGVRGAAWLWGGPKPASRLPGD